MANIVYRGNGTWGNGKGSPLTSAEVDSNFFQLNRNNSNIIANGSGELGTKYWNSSAAFSALSGVSGTFFDAGNTSGNAAATGSFATDKFPVLATVTNTYSLEYQVVGYQGTLYCDIMYYDNSGNQILDGANYGMSVGDMGWFGEFSFVDTVPAGATFAALRVAYTSAKWQMLRWKRVMCSNNRTFPTAFSTDKNWWQLTQQGWSWKNPHEFNGPVWTGIDSAASNSIFLGVEGAQANGNPMVGWKKIDAPADQKHWNAYSDNSNWMLRLVNDGWYQATEVIKATRSGMTITGLNLGRRPTFAGNLAWDAGNFNPGNYVAKTGDLMTGWLEVSAVATTSMVNITADANQEKRIQFGNRLGGPARWAIAVAGDSINRDMYFNRSDVNGIYFDSPMVMRAVSGATDFNGQLNGLKDIWSIGSGRSAYIVLNTDKGFYSSLTFKRTNILRWEFGVDNATENGSNAGSNLFISRWADDGSGIEQVFQMNRASGQTYLNRNLVVKGAPNGVASAALTIDANAGQYRSVKFNANGVQRWEIGSDASAESGSNVGTDWYLSRYNDTGVWQANAIFITRATGTIGFEKRPVFAGNTPWDSGNFDPTLKKNRLGSVTGGAIPTGEIGEVLTFSISPSGVPIGGSTRMPVLDVTLPAGVWLCTLRSILKNAGAVNFFSHTWQPPGTIGMDGYGAATRPKDPNWTTLTNTLYVRSSASILSQVSWYLYGDSGSVDGTVEVTCVRIA